MSAKTRKKSIWMGEPLQQLIASRRPHEEDEVNISGTINTAVSRYLEIVSRHMPTLALGEWCAIFEALSGLMRDDAWSPRYMAMELQDSGGLGQKWGIDQDRLVATLTRLSFVELVAIDDAAERFWASDAQPDDTGWRSMVAPIVGGEHIAP